MGESTFGRAEEQRIAAPGFPSAWDPATLLGLGILIGRGTEYADGPGVSHVCTTQIGSAGRMQSDSDLDSVHK